MPVALNANVVGLAPQPPVVGGRVLLVGSYDGLPGLRTTIHDAVDAARPGDWILVGPGEYKESNDLTNPPSASDVSSGWYGAVDIETPDVHVRAMDRASVVVDGVVDGTKADSPPFSSRAGDQMLGAPGAEGPVGRNGIVVWKADGVSIDNLAVCNFLATGQGGDNGIWWN